jgi:hypothetical protein
MVYGFGGEGERGETNLSKKNSLNLSPNRESKRKIENFGERLGVNSPICRWKG